MSTRGLRVGAHAPRPAGSLLARSPRHARHGPKCEAPADTPEKDSVMRRAAYLALLFALALLIMDSTRPKPAHSDTGGTAPRPASTAA